MPQNAIRLIPDSCLIKLSYSSLLFKFCSFILMISPKLIDSSIEKAWTEKESNNKRTEIIPQKTKTQYWNNKR